MESEIRLIYQDRRVAVAIKPSGILSTDEYGGMPELIREKLGEPQGCVRTVHRLDRVVSGLMVFARSQKAASILSRQVQNHTFEKKYLAILHGQPQATVGTLRDLLYRDKAERKTYVAKGPGKNVQEAILQYRGLCYHEGKTLVEITLETGRTHQIRAQFSSRGLPLVGDRKYGREETEWPIALWSCLLGFLHPETGETMRFCEIPSPIGPWAAFRSDLAKWKLGQDLHSKG